MTAGMPPAPEARSGIGARFVVTGCARSGTGYTARLLSELGYRCGHEQLFHPFTQDVPDFGGWQGDSSWLAVPFLDRLPPDVVVFHQVRDPLEVTKSLVGIRFFHDDNKSTPRRALSIPAATMRRFVSRRLLARRHTFRSDFRNFVWRHVPQVFEGDEEITRCLMYWATWNEMAQARGEKGHAYLRFRIEALDVPLVAHMVQMIGGTPREEQIEIALKMTPKDINRRARDETVDWVMLSKRVFAAKVRELALLYGYEV